MKVIVKQKIHYIIAIVLILLSFGLAFLPLIAYMYSWFGIDFGENYSWNPDIVCVFCAAIFFLVGFVWSDLHKVRYRKATKNWNGELPADIKEESWARCYALYLAAVTMLFAAVVMLIICKINNVDMIKDVILGTNIEETSTSVISA